VFPGLFTSLVSFEDDLYRNIPTIRDSQDLFDDLSDDERVRQHAVTAEMATKETVRSQAIDKPFRYDVAVTWPYMEANWQETRFSDGTRYAVWYGSLDLQTTVCETVHHWLRFLLDAFPDVAEPAYADRRVYLVSCNGLLLDLRGKHAQYPGLLDPDSYAFTHQVGRYVHDQGQNGLLVNSARHPAGVNAAVFERRILFNVRTHCYLSYSYAPADGTVRVERERGEPWLVLARSRKSFV